jgi:hypothetical protein
MHSELSRTASRGKHRKLRLEMLEDRRLLSFTVIGPASGTYNVGDTIAIQFAASNFKAGSKISLCYDKDTVWNNGNEKWIEIDQVTPTGILQTYSWNTSKVQEGTYFLAGYLYQGNNSFTLAHLTQPIVLKLTSPMFTITGPTSTSYTVGKAIPIQWTAGNVKSGSTISLCYDTDTTWNDGNEKWIEIDHVAAANGTGSFSFDSTGLLPGTYYFGGYLYSGNNSFALSHTLEPITITDTSAGQTSFALSAPSSGSYQAGNSVSIQWTAANVSAGSKISLCYDENSAWTGNKQHWIEIDNVTGADGSGSYSWNTTGVTPGTYYVAGYLWNGGNTFTLSHLTTSITITAAGGLTLDAAAMAMPASADTLTTQQLAPIVADAQTRMAAMLGDGVAKTLASVSWEIADLPGGLLGETTGKTVRIDTNAAGYGWYIDPSPSDDAEFSQTLATGVLKASPQSPAASRADLLTTVMHEMGHELGLSHDNLGDLMAATLPLGVRETSLQ